MAGVRRYEDFNAWKLGEAFREEIYGLVAKSKEAREDRKYCSQILDAADGIGSNIAEGFLRFSPGDFARFLDYSVACLGEAEHRLIKGIGRGIFPGGSVRRGAAVRQTCGDRHRQAQAEPATGLETDRFPKVTASQRLILGVKGS